MFKRKSDAASPKEPSKFSMGCLVLFFIPFFAIGIGTFGWGIWGAYQGLASRSWTKVQGVVTHSEVEEHSDSDGTTYGAKIEYAYEWAGQKLRGDQLKTSVPASTSDAAKARETAAHYPAGKAVDVFVNPANPTQAVLKPGLGWSHALLPLFGLVFGGVPSLIMWVNLRSRKKEKETQAAQDAINFEQETQQGPAGLEWDALSGSTGGNFKTHRLQIKKDGTAKIAPSLGLWLFAGVFTLPGLAILLAGLTGAMSDGSAPSWLLRPGISVFGAIFFVVGISTVWMARRGPSFDIHSQCCRNLRRGLKYWGETPQDVPFSQIIGVQLLVYLQTGSEDSYDCYQLNLVAKDHSRWNVMTHGKLESLEADAQTLAQLLRVPLWKRV